MARYSQYVRFFVLLAILAVAAIALGNEPWGPW
jgi:hypothetical protein